MRSWVAYRWGRALLAALLVCLFVGGGIEYVPLFAKSVGRLAAAPLSPEQGRGTVFLPFISWRVPIRTYLPLITRKLGLETTIFGIEPENRVPPDVAIARVDEAGATWMRKNGLLWALVEPREGERNWDRVAELDQQLIDASQRGLQVILIVRRTPRWAQSSPGLWCGPMVREKIPAFATFMHDVVQRYSGPPFNVKYYEIWNEPDVEPALVTPNSIFGCWGDPADEYYGGGYYAEMLKSVYPQMKAANPTAQVVLGGLLLNCDPRLPDRCPDSKPPKFFEGILRNGGGPFFDGVSFHAYDYFKYTPPVEVGLYGNSGFNSAYNTTGPIVGPKTRFVTDLLGAYGVTGKFLMNTESALICGGNDDPTAGPGCESNPDSPFEITKAYYIPEAYAVALAAGLRANVWYSLEGWRNSGLVFDDGTPRPAYYTFIFARNQLGTARFTRELTEYPDVFGYEFDRGDRRIWVLWSRDRAPRSLVLPGTPSAVYDPFGTALPATNPLTVDVMPRYVEWSP